MVRGFWRTAAPLGGNVDGYTSIGGKGHMILESNAKVDVKCCRQDVSTVLKVNLTPCLFILLTRSMKKKYWDKRIVKKKLSRMTQKQKQQCPKMMSTLLQEVGI
jgi:hypothetical protein